MAKMIRVKKKYQPPQSEETKRKISEGLMGQKKSEEHKANMRLAQQRRRAREKENNNETNK